MKILDTQENHSPEIHAADYEYVDVCGLRLKKNSHHKEEPNGGIYSSLGEALGQDINFVYLFDPKVSKWETFR